MENLLQLGVPILKHITVCHHRIKKKLAQNNKRNCLKMDVGFYDVLMHPKYAGGMTNSLGPYQAGLLGAL